MAQGNQPQKRNLAVEAFRRKSDVLRNALTEPDAASRLATKLYSGAAIITSETRDVVQMASFTPMQQTSMLLQAVESSIKTDHTRLRRLIRELRKQPVLKPIAKQLRQCYCELVSEAKLTESSNSGSDSDSTEQHQFQAVKLQAVAAGTHTASPSLQGTPVKEEALPELLNILYPVACNWELFAQQIGVPFDHISHIKAANPQAGPSYCFSHALKWWQSNLDSPVYEIIIDVLDPGIGKVTPAMNRACAKEVREFMAKQSAMRPTTTTNSSSDRECVTEVSMSSETASLFSEPGSVCGSDNKVLLSQVRKDYFDIRKLSEQEKLGLQCRLLQDSDKIMDEFSDLTHYTIESIASSCVSVKELHTHLSGLGAYKPIHEQVPLLRDQLNEIKRAENVKDVFNILHDYYSFFNYHIIEKLIGWFGTPEDKKRLETYMKNFERFCKRMTFECPPDIFGSVNKGKTSLVVKVEESWGPAKGCPLETVIRLRNTLGDILGVEPSTLYLCRIDEGCVELMFQVPSFIEDIFPLSINQEKSLTSIRVTRLTCVNYSFSHPPEDLVPQNSAQAETEVKQKVAMFPVVATDTSTASPDLQAAVAKNNPTDILSVQHILTERPTQVMHPVPAPQKNMCQDCKKRVATLICFQCLPVGFMFCDTCSELEHSRAFAPVKDHAPRPIANVRFETPVPNCQVHVGVPCLYFSFRVNKFACEECRGIFNFEQDQYMSIDTAVAQVRDELPTLIQLTREHVDTIAHTRAQLDELLKRVDQEGGKALDRVRVEFQQFEIALKNRLVSVEQTIERESLKKALTQQIEELEVAQGRLDVFVVQANMILQMPDCTYLQQAETIMDNIKGELSEEDVVLYHLGPVTEGIIPVYIPPTFLEEIDQIGTVGGAMAPTTSSSDRESVPPTTTTTSSFGRESMPPTTTTTSSSDRESMVPTTTTTSSSGRESEMAKNYPTINLLVPQTLTGDWTLECPVCVEQYGQDFNHTPRILRCGHTFCTRCLTRLMTPKGAKCPVCNNVDPLDQPNVLHLPPNYAVMQILKTSKDSAEPEVRSLPEPDCEYCKKNPAEKVCIDCSPGAQVKFCVQCDSEWHYRPFASVQRHRRYPINQLPTLTPTCSTHRSNEATLYSLKLNQFACNECSASPEWVLNQHEFEPIQQAVLKLRSRAQRLNQYSQEVIGRLSQSEVKIGQIVFELAPSVTTAKNEIQMTFNNLIIAIQERQQALVEKVDDVYDEWKHNLETQLDQVRQTQQKFMESHQALNDLLPKPDWQFLLGYRAISEKMEELLISEDRSLQRPIAHEVIPFFVPQKTLAELRKLGSVGGGATVQNISCSSVPHQNNLLQLQWELPNCCEEVLQYQIKYEYLPNRNTASLQGSAIQTENYDNIGPHRFEIPGDALSSYVDDLCPGYRYRFWIRSASEAGWGMWSNPAEGTCDDFPITVGFTKKIHRVTIPVNGYYRIEARGAKAKDGKRCSGGNGAIIVATFALRAGDTLTILAGGMSRLNVYDSGGGGGSFVAVNELVKENLLIAAGGGGGTRGFDDQDENGRDANLEPWGTDGCGHEHGKGGRDGGPGEDADGFVGPCWGYGGAGFQENSSAARSFFNGGAGGQFGGFGGGGPAGQYGGGGGGGYSGGGGGRGGGGGGSYVRVDGIDVDKRVGNNGHGSIRIEQVPPPFASPIPPSHSPIETAAATEVASSANSSGSQVYSPPTTKEHYNTDVVAVAPTPHYPPSVASSGSSGYSTGSVYSTTEPLDDSSKGIMRPMVEEATPCLIPDLEFEVLPTGPPLASNNCSALIPTSQANKVFPLPSLHEQGTNVLPTEESPVDPVSNAQPATLPPGAHLV